MKNSVYKILVFLLWIVSPFHLLAQSVISNVRAIQDGRNVVLLYDLSKDAEIRQVKIDVDGRSRVLPMSSLSGDVGKKVSRGADRRIVYNVLEDYKDGLRSDNVYFVIEDIDQVTLSQKGVESKSTITYKTYKYKSPSAYRSYCEELGTFELIFCGTSGAIGNGGLWGVRALSCRMGPVQINPLEIGVCTKDKRKYRFYTPSVDFYIPINCHMALYFGGGPTYATEVKDSGTDGEKKNSGIDASVGFHWGCAVNLSSDFFFRYNGSYMIGVSINWCMGI